MNYEHFGILLQELRLNHNMSREKLAENICSPKQIYRIEKGESEQSVSLLHQLSIVFNMDLNEYYKMFFMKNTLTAFEGANAINNAIESGDIQLIKILTKQYEGLDDFKKGEPFQIICYAKALCSALIDQDYKTSLAHCLKGIKTEYFDFCLNNISNKTYSNIGITLLICISQNYFAIDHYFLGMKVLTSIQTVIETYFLNTLYPMYNSKEFYKKIYQAVLSNISVHLYEHGEIEKALENTEEGIKFATNEDNLKLLPNFLSIKCKILYRMQRSTEAKEFYEHAVHL